MAISNADPIVTYTGDSIALSFPITFDFQSNADWITVVITPAGSSTPGAPLTLDVDFTVDSLGNVVFGVAPATGAQIAISRVMPFDQQRSLPTQGRFAMSEIEAALDQCTMQDQENQANVAALADALAIETAARIAGDAAAISSITAGSGNVGVPENRLPNAQWQVMTLVGAGPKMLADGTGPMPAVNVSSYTTATNTAVSSCSDTKTLKVGDLVKFDSSAHANMRICPHRIASMTANVSFTTGVARGLTGGTTAACTAQPWDAGAAASAGLTDAADGWQKSSTLWVWREDNQVNVQPGSKFSLGTKKQSSAAELVWREIPTRDLPTWAGRQIVFGAAAMQGIKTGLGTWRLFVSVNSVLQYAASATSRAFSWQELSIQLPNVLTQLSFGWSLEGSSGDVYYLTHPTAGFGSVLGAFNFQQRRDEILELKQSLEPLTLAASSFAMPTTPLPSSDNTSLLGGGVGNSFGFRVRPGPETEGKIAVTVRALMAQIRATFPAATLNRTNALKKLRLQVVLGGARGTATVRVSADGGTTWSSTQTTAATMSWPSGTYSGDANNADVRYQSFSLGTGTYVANDYWDIDTNGTITFTGTMTGGASAVSVTPVQQQSMLGARKTDTAPYENGLAVFAAVANLAAGGQGFLTLDDFGDFDLYSECLTTAPSAVTVDINAALLV